VPPFTISQALPRASRPRNWSEGVTADEPSIALLGGDTQATAFFGKTYDEAMALLVEARDYFTHREPIDRQTLQPPELLHFCRETLRLTTRLTQIMAWLLAQRAVFAGEISQRDALGDHDALAELRICMEAEETAASVMPQRLAGLLDRSRRLYVRVARLDELARRQLA
jgi:regulator of CtrA degradation